MAYVGALWGAFGWVFSHSGGGGGEQFWGNFGWLSPFTGAIWRIIWHFSLFGWQFGDLGGNLAGLPLKSGAILGGWVIWLFGG